MARMPLRRLPLRRFRLRRLSPHRWSAASGIAATLVLVACGWVATPTPVPATPTPSPTADPVAVAAARDAYAIAICPVLIDLGDADPRLIALREAGAAGGDVSPQGGEVDALGEELELILNRLGAIPDWETGHRFQQALTINLHEIRVALAQLRELIVNADASAAEEMAAIPLIVNDEVERGFNEAVEEGFSCAPSGNG